MQHILLQFRERIKEHKSRSKTCPAHWEWEWHYDVISILISGQTFRLFQIKQRIKEHKSRSKTCPAQHFSTKLVKKKKKTLRVTWCYFHSHFGTDFQTFFKLNSDLWDTFVHFNPNSARVDDNNKKKLKLTWLRLNTTNGQKDQYQRSSLQ